MYIEQVEIRRKEGIHARPASVFVKEAARFHSDIFLELGETRVNGKSIMGLLMLALSPGMLVKIEAKGSDEKEAVRALAKVLGAEM